MNTADKTSEKINSIRAAALFSLGAEPHAKCPTCTRPAAMPYRLNDFHGKITGGCVDAFHTEHLVGISSSNRWHNRPEAKALRRAELAHLNSV